MSRIKTFISDGSNPNGRLFAGDLNAIQDQYADLTNLAQTHSVGTLVVGEAGLQLLRFGAGEARISGALRTDGIFRGLGGLIAGAFTSTQRDAIVSPPFGLVILNTTTNQYEWNLGTPSVPVWASLGGDSPGVIKMTGMSSAPSGYLLCNGAAVSRATYAALFTAISTAYGAGDGSTTFNLPDMQGRVPVGLGTHTDVNALGKNDGVALGSRRPRHKHTVINPTISAPSFSLAVNTHSHGGVTGTENQNHSHAPSHGGNFVTWNSSGATGTDPGIDTGTRWAIGDAFNAQSNIESAAHNHNIGAEAPGVNGSINAPTASNGQVGPQTGAEPLDSEAFVVVNFIIKT